MKAIGYIRTTLAGRDEVDQQTAALNAAAQANGDELVRVYVDEGVAGSRVSDGPGLQALIEVAYSRAFPRLYVTRLDRLAQNARDLKAVCWTLFRLDISLYLTEERRLLTKDQPIPASLV